MCNWTDLTRRTFYNDTVKSDNFLPNKITSSTEINIKANNRFRVCMTKKIIFRIIVLKLIVLINRAKSWDEKNSYSRKEKQTISRHQKDGKRKIPKFRNECMNVWNSSLTVIPDFLYGYNQFLWNNLLSQCGTIDTSMSL
uniref:Uncharacterized protein n=1 Tax=Rhizophagus irregularis (strain DAOM 181602 / DAOM 197198 / MUCL 43194) TaxID=747089 RepID=U9ST43_RHIID